MAHDIQVKVMLTAEEFLALRSVSDEIGTTQSGLLRQWMKEKLRIHASSIGASAEKTTDESGKE
jgi:hypothetical protein